MPDSSYESMMNHAQERANKAESALKETLKALRKLYDAQGSKYLRFREEWDALALAKEVLSKYEGKS